MHRSQAFRSARLARGPCSRVSSEVEAGLVALEERLDRKLVVGGEHGGISTVEVVMRPPEVFVRPLLHDEAVRLKRLSKRAKHQCTRQRAAVLLASNVKMSASQIAEMWRTDDSWVRKVIHEFNERGMNSLRPRYRGGRPGSRLISASRSSPWPVPVPITRGCR